MESVSDHDLLVHGGDGIDGSGAPRFRADVRVRGGRIVEVREDLASRGEPGIDATGAVVIPGFIDSHAHTDAHVFWNPTLDPDPLHGVTTMLIGNCGLSLFPVTDATRATVSDLFAFVEDTTLLLTRHVRERGDFTLEQGVHELTGRQVDAFGFTGRGSVRMGAVADLVVFALDELHYDADEFVHDLPDGGPRLRRPEGGYRATIVDGVVVQRGGELTGALPGRVISAGA
jgi:N-acyl-D-aspartate/D-glutamate deacylase